MPPRVANPPPASVLDGDVRIVKVRQPWATFLVKGIKTVENRSWCLHPATALPAWVLVASSKSRPTKAMMADLRSRLRRCMPGGHSLALRFDTDPDDYDYGAILGLVKLDRCYTPSSQPASDAPTSVWYNRGDVAWILSDAWEFRDPIRLSADDKMQTQARLASRPQYLPRLREEIDKLEPEDL